MTGVLHIVLARKPIEGTIAENCLKHGCGALNIDGCRIAALDGKSSRVGHSDKNSPVHVFGPTRMHAEPDGKGRFPANIVLGHSEGCVEKTVEQWECVEGCPVKILDGQSGTLRARGNVTPTKRNGAFWGNSGEALGEIDSGDKGGASRFFKQVDEFDEQLG